MSSSKVTSRTVFTQTVSKSVNDMKTELQQLDLLKLLRAATTACGNTRATFQIRASAARAESSDTAQPLWETKVRPRRKFIMSRQKKEKRGKHER